MAAVDASIDRAARIAAAILAAQIVLVINGCHIRDASLIELALIDRNATPVPASPLDGV